MEVKANSGLPPTYIEAARKMYDAIKHMRKVKWRLDTKPYQLQALTKEHNRIIIKLAHMNAAIDTDIERSIWQGLYDACMFMSDLFAKSANR